MTPTPASIGASSSLAEYLAAGGGESAANQNIVHQLVSRELVCCVSSLVSTIAKVASEAGEFGDTDSEEILDLFRGIPDYEEAARDEGWELASDSLHKAMDEADEARLHAIHDAVMGEQDGPAGYPSLQDIANLLLDRGNLTFLKLTAERDGWPVEHSSVEDWQELCNDERIEPNEPEVYEHWIVSSWAMAKLMEHGERVGEIEGMTVWGRCTTGQAICLDRVWHAIAAEMQILQGQANDWSRVRQ